MKKKANAKSKTKAKNKANTNVQKTAARQSSKAAAQTTDFADYLALMPGLLMCVMLLIMLMLDIALPGMAEKQYEDFPNMFTVFDYLITACGLLYICIAAKRRELRFEKADALFMAFALLIVVSTLVNGLSEFTFDGAPYRYIGILNMFSFMLIYMGVTRAIKRESFGDYILLGYLAAADLIGLAALIDRVSGGIAAFGDKKELSAVFFNGNHYGYFLMMAALIGAAYFLFSENKPAVFGAVSAGLNLILLAINHSLGSILALLIVLAGTALVIILKDRSHMRRLGLLVAAAAVALVVGFIISPALRKEFTGLFADLSAILSRTAEGTAGHRRLQMWTLTAGYISEKPLLGYGCEGIALMLYEAMKVSNPHCEVLTYAAFYGIPAAILYAAGVIAAIAASLRNTEANRTQQKAACMAAAGYFISSFVGVGMFYTLPFFFIFLGLARKR